MYMLTGESYYIMHYFMGPVYDSIPIPLSCTTIFSVYKTKTSNDTASPFSGHFC